MSTGDPFPVSRRDAKRAQAKRQREIERQYSTGKHADARTIEARARGLKDYEAKLKPIKAEARAHAAERRAAVRAQRSSEQKMSSLSE